MGLANNGTIETLSLGKLIIKWCIYEIAYNKIGSEGANEIAVSLEDNNTITSLNIGFAAFKYRKQ